MRVCILLGLLLLPLASAGIPESMSYSLDYSESGRVVGDASFTHVEAETSYVTSLAMDWRIESQQTLYPGASGIWSRAGSGSATLHATGTFTLTQDGIAGHDEGTCALAFDTTVPASASIAKADGKLYVAIGENAHPAVSWVCEGAAFTRARPFLGASVEMAQRAQRGEVPGALAAALGYTVDAASWNSMGAEDRQAVILRDGATELEEREEQETTFAHDLDPSAAPGDEVCRGLVVPDATIESAECRVTGSVRATLRAADDAMDDMGDDPSAYSASSDAAGQAPSDRAQDGQAATPGPGALALVALGALVALAGRRRA